MLSYAVARTPGASATRRPSRFLDGTAAVLGDAARSQPKRSRKRGQAGAKAATPVRTTCRACGADLGTARERTIGRCSACPPTMDERLFEALREWRLEQARAADVPAFVVFTDATLTAIAERVPADAGAAGPDQRRGPGQARALRRPTSSSRSPEFFFDRIALCRNDFADRMSFATEIHANNPVAGRAQAPLP